VDESVFSSLFVPQVGLGPVGDELDWKRMVL
jgi:hypothetical protein